jgi:hypothetical protein
MALLAYGEMTKLMITAKAKRVIRRKIERWLSQHTRVKISVEMILDYVYSGALPRLIDDDGVKWSYIFYPEAATEFALLWAECWLSHNPDAEIHNVEVWAEAVAGGNQILAERKTGGTGGF